MSIARHSRVAFAALLSSLYVTSVRACPDCQDEQCVGVDPLRTCVCVQKIGCTISIPIPGATQPDSPIPVSPIPLPPPLQAEVDKWGKDASRTVEKLGDDTLTTFQKAGGDTLRTLQKAGGDTFATIQTAGDDTIKTTFNAAADATATYVRAWSDVGEQGKRSFSDAVDAGQAVVHYVENQAKAEMNAAENAAKRLRDGKVVDSMWGLATEPLKANEENFAKATQESKVINAAAGTAAAVYGGPAGAAAYAAWSTYRQTGNADMALRAGVLAAVTSQMGSSVASMPAGTAGEVIKKAAVAGAAGGISVAAAGGDEQAIKDGFLKSAGAVLVQASSDQVKAYAPQAADAYKTVQCLSARDVDCLSKTTWVRDAEGKILYDQDGKPRIDTTKLDPNQYIGKWTGLDSESAAGKENAFITQISKLPKMEAIPVLKNQWVLTWSLGGKTQDIAYSTPTVVLTYVGKDAPFKSAVEYSGIANTQQVSLPTKDEDGTAETMKLRSQLVALKPTLNSPPLWQMLPNALWYVYRGTIGGLKKCWLKGTLISTSGGVAAQAARIYVAPSALPNSTLVMVAHVDDLKIVPTSRPTINIDGTKLAMTVSEDGELMFLNKSEMEAEAISLMKAKKSVTLIANTQDGHEYKFTSSLSDFSEAVRLITKECR
jgi:hypothetical protein